MRRLNQGAGGGAPVGSVPCPRMDTSLLLVLAESDAYRTGYIFGRVILFVLIIALIVWSIQRYRSRG